MLRQLTDELAYFLMAAILISFPIEPLSVRPSSPSHCLCSDSSAHHPTEV